MMFNKLASILFLFFDDNKLCVFDCQLCPTLWRGGQQHYER